MLIVAHRGLSYTAPENTLVSVNLAWNTVADIVEIDVRLTKDNKIVVIHDATTLRTTGVDLKVAETDYETLAKLDAGKFKNEKFSGEKIPLLEEVIKTIPKGKKLFVEIKCGTEILPFLKEVFVKSGKLDQLIVIGFDFNLMVEVKHLLPTIPVYWLVFTKRGKKHGTWVQHGTKLITKAKENGLDGVNIFRAGVTKKFVDTAHKKGLVVSIWTVNSVKKATRLYKLGVDSITTDRSDWLPAKLSGYK